jgi:tetratricopeptide (TPR) repeat protein
MAVALYLSGTRGSVAGLFAGALGAAVIYVILTKHRRIRRAGIAVIGAGLVAVGIMFAISSHLPADSLIHRLFIWDDADAKSRILNWGIAVKGYPHNPIFGVGPENYYFISNKYYNPAIYAYDPSYLARPHNYFLELLVTTGPLGLLAYLTVACLAIWALCRAYRSGRLNLIGMAVLAGALVAYQTQNLTLFDTVSGGIVFFTLLGIAGHIRTAPSNDVQRDHKALSVTRPALGKLRWVVAVGAATAAGAIYFTNVLPLRAAVDTAKAEAVASTDPFQAADNYDQAVNTPFNFDQTDLALSLADFAGGLAENATDVTQKQLAQQELDRSINLSAQVADHNPTSARNWIDLANDYVAQFIGFGGTLNGAQPALDHAIDLEPERPEPGLLQADVFALKNRLPEAESVLQNLAANFPTIERVNQRLAYVLQGEGKTADGVSWFEKAVRLGYVPPNYASIKWVGDYYAGQGQYSKEVALYGKTLTTTDPNDIDLAVALVNAYQKNGQRDAAFALYQKIIAIDPNRAKDMPHVAPAGA